MNKNKINVILITPNRKIWVLKNMQYSETIDNILQIEVNKKVHHFRADHVFFTGKKNKPTILIKDLDDFALKPEREQKELLTPEQISKIIQASTINLLALSKTENQMKSIFMNLVQLTTLGLVLILLIKGLI